MKNLIWIIVLFAVAIGLAIIASLYHGNAYIVIGDMMFSMNLHLFVLALFVLILILYVLLRFITGVLNLPGALGRFGVRRKSRQALQQLNKAGQSYFEGKYRQAAQEAQKVLDNKQAGESKALALMLAANAAEHGGDESECERYLAQMAKLPAKMQLPRHLLQAEVALNRQDLENAEISLKSAEQLNPRLTALVRLQLRLAIAKKQPWSVLEKAEKLHRAAALTEQEWKEISEQAYADLLAAVQDARDMKNALKRIAPEMKAGALSGHIATRYVELGLYNKAFEWVRQYYPQNRDATLLKSLAIAVHYLGNKMQQKAIDIADIWLREDEQNVDLLMLLGELSYGQKLWGKAKAYMEAVLKIENNPTARLLLAKVLDECGEEAAAEQQRQSVLASLEQEIEHEA